MSPNRSDKLTAAQILFPLSLVAFVLFLLLGFQLTQILRDREALHAAKLQQDKPLEDANKVQAQLEALATGTKKLAESGDTAAQAIIDRMKQLGITVGSPPSAGAPAPAPAMDQAPAQR